MDSVPILFIRNADGMIFYSGDPAKQGYSPYGYGGGNPVIYVDKDGRIFLIDDILIGSAIGALISGATYSAAVVLTGNPWTWEGFGKSFAFGAIGGGISAGFGTVFD